MSHDPLRDAFERMAPTQVSPAEARDRLGALSPGFRSARRTHRIRTGVAGVTAVVALAVGGPVAIAAIAPGSSNPAVDFASQDEVVEESTDTESIDDESVGDDTPDTDTSSSSEDSSDDGIETVEIVDDSDSSDDVESEDHSSGTLGGGGSDDDDDPADHDAGDDSSDDSDSDSDSDDSDGGSHDDDDSDDDDSDDDDSDDEDGSPAGQDVVEGVTYTDSGPGGSLSVSVVGGALRYEGSTPAAGFTVSITEDGDEIKADFSSASDEHRIEVEYEHGQLFWHFD